ncbi:MAG: twin-arginine translocase TatA/TatE family subunit [Anaerolineales bacterium]|nr:twin-arginine translocase TatA/TatE family subunit [Anaerolineales bacterium]
MLPFGIGIPELIIVLVIVIILFGAGRIGKIAGELGQGIREFRQGIKGSDSAESKPSESDLEKGY